MPLPAPPTDDTSVATFASKIRTKYPGAYDDMDDESLARATLKKHPEYHDMLPKGFTMDPPTQFEKERTGDKPGFWKNLGDSLPSLSSLAATANPVTGPAALAYNAAKGLYDTVTNAPKRAKEEYAADKGMSPATRVAGAAAAPVAPLVGISPEKMRDSASKGDTAGIVGQLALPTALAAAPMLKEAGGKALDALDERSVPKDIEAGKSGILRVLKPKPGAGGAAADALEKSVHTAVDEGDLPKIFRESPLKGKGAAVMGDAIDKIDAYQDKLWEEGHQAPVSRRVNMPFDSTKVQARALGVIDDAAERTSTPAQVSQARRWVANAFKPNLTVGTVDKMIRTLNAEIKEPPEAWGPIGARVRMEALKGLRDSLDDHLEQPYQGQPGEIGVRNVNTRWGALDAIKQRLGERYWSEWQKQAARDGSPVPSWMRAYAFAHPGGVALVAGARLTGSMMAPADAEVFASSAKKLAGTRMTPRPTGQVGMVGRLPKGPTP